jgi:RNA recognition motif-containing protein
MKKESIMNIYIGNLSRDTTEDDLKTAFETYGKIVTVNVVKNNYNGESRGFGFVEMASNDEGKAAIEGLNGKDLKGQTLKVNEAHARSDSRSRGGRRF